MPRPLCLPLVCTLLAAVLSGTVSTGSAATPAPVDRLPAGYTRGDFPGISTRYTDGSTHLLLAQHTGGRAEAFLVVARDARTGRTLWKSYGTGIGHFEPVVAGQGGVYVQSFTTGAITRGRALLLAVQTGKTLRSGLFSIPAVRDGVALLLDTDEPPLSAPFLEDPTRLVGQVLDLHTGQVITRDFPIPTRPGCGALKPLVVSSSAQQFAVKAGRLEATRQDGCGEFTATFAWWASPLPAPALRRGR